MSPCFCTNLRLATRRLTAVHDKALAALGVHIGQYFMLRIISDRASISLTELGQHAELERSTMGDRAAVAIAASG